MRNQSGVGETIVFAFVDLDDVLEAVKGGAAFGAGLQAEELHAQRQLAGIDGLREVNDLGFDQDRVLVIHRRKLHPDDLADAEVGLLVQLDDDLRAAGGEVHQLALPVAVDGHLAGVVGIAAMPEQDLDSQILRDGNAGIGTPLHLFGLVGQIKNRDLAAGGLKAHDLGLEEVLVVFQLERQSHGLVDLQGERSIGFVVDGLDMNDIGRDGHELDG